MQHTQFVEHHLSRESLRYLSARDVDVSTSVVEYSKRNVQELVRIAAKGHDPIDFEGAQSCCDAGVIIGVCASNDLDVDDLWTLLCVGVG